MWGARSAAAFEAEPSVPREDEDTVTKHTTHTPAVPAALDDPLVNRGVAFTHPEREALGLTGRLPSAVLPLEAAGTARFAF